MARASRSPRPRPASPPPSSYRRAIPWRRMRPCGPLARSSSRQATISMRRAAPPLDTVYVPIGLGSGICGVIAMRDALSPSTKVVGVVSTEAPAYALSFAAGKVVATNSANTMADGMAVRGPDAEALAVILKGADRIVQVSDAEIAAAMRAYYEDTHQLTEGAGAASLAALLQERKRLAGKRVGLILSGGNIDRPLYLRTLAG